MILPIYLTPKQLFFSRLGFYVNILNVDVAWCAQWSLQVLFTQTFVFYISIFLFLLWFVMILFLYVDSGYWKIEYVAPCVYDVLSYVINDNRNIFSIHTQKNINIQQYYKNTKLKGKKSEDKYTHRMLALWEWQIKRQDPTFSTTKLKNLSK